MNKSLKYIVLFSLLSGCSVFDDDWPNLADPLPKPPERSQVDGLPAGGIVSTTKVRDSKPLSADEASAAFTALKGSLVSEWQAYQASTAKLTDKTDAETALINWGGAQLALSRVSSNIGTIQDLTMSAFDLSTPEDAQLLKAISEYVRAEEARLNSAREQLISVKP